MPGPVIGIDLGTTCSRVGVFRGGEVEIIPNGLGNRSTPSYVSFTGTGTFIGGPARDQAAGNSTNTVFDAKRLIGRNFDDPVVQADMKLWPFKVVEDGQRPKIEVEYKRETKSFYAEEILAVILAKMKQTAEDHLDTEVTDSVITVPSLFNDSQRKATEDAGKIAGLNVLRIINEPTAAAIAYELPQRVDQERNVVIFDLGGGTLSVSLVAIEEGIVMVKATDGNNHLGGEDFDNRMVEHFINEFRRKHKKDITSDRRAVFRLKAACEEAKITLASSTQADIKIGSLFDGIDLNTMITRERFEEICGDAFRRAMRPVIDVLRDAGLERSEIHEVVCVGGSSRIPKIQELLQGFFSDGRLNNNINPEEAVVYGAAVQAAVLAGIESDGIRNLLLIDVCPLSLGVETAGGLMEKVIPRNTTIPARRTRTVTLFNRSHVSIQVYEGERPVAKNNNPLGELKLTGFPEAPEMSQRQVIEMTFDLDVNGILEVLARVAATGEEARVTITNHRGRLTEDEIRRMRADVERYKMEDRAESPRIRDRIRARNALLSSVCGTENTMEDNGFQNSGDDRRTVLGKCREIRDWLEKNQSANERELEAKQTSLEGVCQPIITRLYQQVVRERVSAAGALGNYVHNMKTVAENDAIGISEEDRRPVIDKCREIIGWLSKHPAPEMCETENRQNEVEVNCQPVITKLLRARRWYGGLPVGTPLKRLQVGHPTGT